MDLPVNEEDLQQILDKLSEDEVRRIIYQFLFNICKFLCTNYIL